MSRPRLNQANTKFLHHIQNTCLYRAFQKEISANLFPLTNCFFLAENEHPVGKVAAEIAGGQARAEPLVLGSLASSDE